MRKSYNRIIGRAALVVIALLAFTVVAFSQAFTSFYGKNKVKYDKHRWEVYRSPHFEVYYYPEFEQELGRLVSYAESAYEKVSNDLKHEISFAIPLILYKTFSEFAQTNLLPFEIPEGVGAFAEPSRDRMVIPIDNPPDELQELFIHELTHIFQFDIIPRSLVRRSVPVWIDEGMATYMEDEWDPLDLMVIRDAAVTDQIPSFEALNVGFARAAYSFGASVFTFMEERFGKEGVRQFIFALRRAVVGGVGEEVYQQAFRLTPEEFYREWKRWLVDKYKPFRDKEIPDDYSLDMSPDPRRGNFVAALSAAPSPSKEIIAVMSVNRKEGEFDIILLSAADGSIIKNLTPGYTGAFETIVGLVGEDSLIGRNISWDAGRRSHRVLRPLSQTTRAHRRRRAHRESRETHSGPGRPGLLPACRPQGPIHLFHGASGRDQRRLARQHGDGGVRECHGRQLLRQVPTVTPDGEWLYYSRRISGYDKIYRLKLSDTSKKEQITFGTHDDASPTFSDDGRVMFYTSNEDDDIYNLRSMDVETGDIIQYTDVLGGNFSPAIIKGGPRSDEDILLFTSYYKGNYGLYKLPMNEPVKELSSDLVVRTEGPVIDFVPPVNHQIISENKRRKGTFEKFYIDGAPPINVGVTSGGDFFGGTGISFSDVLGDQNFTFFALSVRQFRSYLGSYTNRAGRLQYAITGFDTTSFFFANPFGFAGSNVFTRDDALSTIRQYGATASAVYPLSRFRRLEMSAGIVRQSTGFEDPALNPLLNPGGIGFGGDFDQFQDSLSRRYPNGTALPVSATFVQETTRFRNFGPLAGSTVLAGVSISPSGPFLSRQTFNLDARKYLQIGGASLLALRLRGLWSNGENPDLFWFGGNGDMRGYEYQSFVGNQGFSPMLSFASQSSTPRLRPSAFSDRCGVSSS